MNLQQKQKQHTNGIDLTTQIQTSIYLRKNIFCWYKLVEGEMDKLLNLLAASVIHTNNGGKHCGEYFIAIWTTLWQTLWCAGCRHAPASMPAAGCVRADASAWAYKQRSILPSPPAASRAPFFSLSSLLSPPRRIQPAYSLL